MLKAKIAGALALVMVGFLSLSTVETQASEWRSGEQGAQISEVNIYRIKSALHLTPEQMHYWGPVESALLRIANEQAQDESSGFVKRMSRRVVSIALTAVAVQRLASSAAPLIRSLDDEQKRIAVSLAHEMGLGPVVAALN